MNRRNSAREMAMPKYPSGTIKARGRRRVEEAFWFTSIFYKKLSRDIAEHRTGQVFVAVIAPIAGLGINAPLWTLPEIVARRNRATVIGRRISPRLDTRYFGGNMVQQMTHEQIWG